jgi:hypothetical protein
MVQGTVDKLWRNERPDGSKYWVVSIDGKRYSTWNEQLIRNLTPGDEVAFSCTTSGRHHTLMALKRVGQPRRAKPETLVASRTSRPIVRMSCLRTAAELLRGSNLLPEQRLAACVTFSQRLERHVLQLCADSDYNPRYQTATDRATKPSRDGPEGSS